MAGSVILHTQEVETNLIIKEVLSRLATQAVMVARPENIESLEVSI
jgi:hypothetical protein